MDIARLAELFFPQGIAAAAPIRAQEGRGPFRITPHEGEPIVLKRYGDAAAPAPHEQDRLVRESMALRFLNDELQLSTVPRLLRMAPSQLVLLMEYIEGSPVSGACSDKEVDAAADFIAALNDNPDAMDLWQLPAVGAAFTFDETREKLLQNAAQLRGGATRTAAHEAMLDFVSGEVAPFLEKMRFSGEMLSMALPEDYRILSPGGFGLHDAIRRVDGSLAFTGFARFGWEDPAMVVADFLWETHALLSDAQRQRFVSRCAASLEIPRLIAARLPAAYTLAGIRWGLAQLRPFLEGAEEETLHQALHACRDAVSRAMAAYPHGPCTP
jgi:hypothetical protein